MSIITNPLGVPRMDITSARGVPFMILVDVDADLVEFWDLRFPMPHFNTDVRAKLDADMPGQFVARYNVDIVMGGISGRNLWAGVVLNTGDPTWTIDGAAMSLVRRWLHFTCNRAASLRKDTVR